MTYQEFEAFVEKSVTYLKARNEYAWKKFNIGGFPRYEYDLYRGEIWWGGIGSPKIRARVSIVGTISTRSNTWLWSWANPHFEKVILGDIEKIKLFGETEGITKLTEEQWSAEEVDGWEMTAVAARLLESEGAYKSPGENTSLFLLFDRLEPIPIEEVNQYMPLKRPDPSI